MRILVTGSSGFIGTHLCRRLTADGHEVVGLDRNGDGEFTTIVADVRCPDLAVYSEIFDRIYVMACIASPKWYLRDQIYTITTSFEGTRLALDCSMINKARILLASTSEIYGQAPAGTIEETYNGNVHTLSPRSCYDEGKRAAETLMMSYSRERKVDIRIARIFNTYGPGMDPDDGRVITEMINRALSNEEIIVHYPGTQTRSFSYIDDTVDALIQLMESGSPLAASGAINIGSGQDDIMMLTLAGLIAGLCGSELGVEMKPGYPSDPQRRIPDTTLMNKVIEKGTFKTPLKEGLEKTIEYYRSLRG